MTYVTRDLLSFAVGRNAGEMVTFITLGTFNNNNDGSYSPIETETEIRARIDDLTISQIKRLQDRGITINQGINISVVGELEKQPDRVRRSDGTTYKIIDYAIVENASVMIADLPPLGEAIE